MVYKPVVKMLLTHLKHLKENAKCALAWLGWHEQTARVLDDFRRGRAVEGLLPSQLLPSMEAPEKRRGKTKQEKRRQAERRGDYLILQHYLSGQSSHVKPFFRWRN